MKNKSYVLLLISFFLLSQVQLFAQFENEGIVLSIKNIEEKNGILALTLDNTGKNVVLTDQLDRSNINKIIIFNPNNEKISRDYIICHTEGYVKIRPGEKKIWYFDIERYLNPFISRRVYENGKYTVIWAVNNMESEPLIYEKR